jgi:hypothetical protein
MAIPRLGSRRKGPVRLLRRASRLHLALRRSAGQRVPGLGTPWSIRRPAAFHRRMAADWRSGAVSRTVMSGWLTNSSRTGRKAFEPTQHAIAGIREEQARKRESRLSILLLLSALLDRSLWMTPGLKLMGRRAARDPGALRGANCWNGQNRRKRNPKTVLTLDLEQSKPAVLNSLTSQSSQRPYDHALANSSTGRCSEPSPRCQQNRRYWHLELSTTAQGGRLYRVPQYAATICESVY